MRRISFSAWTVPLILLIVVIAAYGLFAAQQGIHWDDWVLVWIPTFLGKQGLIHYFSVRRPVWGYFFVMTTSLLGTNLLGWQIFAITWQWLASVALWWALRLAWPRNSRAVLFMTLFIVLYPGFSQHSIAIFYGHFFLIFTFFFLSFAFMLLGQRQPKYYWPALIGGVLCSAINLFSLEYYFGIELLRPLLLWMVISDITPEKRSQIKRTLLAYLPYAFVLGCFGLWRLFGFHSQMYQVQSFGASGAGIMQSLTPLLGEILRAIWASSVQAWWGIFHIPPMSEMGLSLSIIYVLLSLISFAGLMFYVLRLQHSEIENQQRTEIRTIQQCLILGGCAILTAGIPFYLVGLQVRLAFPADRLTQPFAFGTALILVALLELIPSNSWRVGIAATLVALAIGLQIQYGFSYRQDWKLQKAYFWQLSWRAPAIKPGTAILSDNTIFTYTDDDALTLPLNWIYWPTGKSGSLPYAQKFFSVNAGSAVSLTPGSPVVMSKDSYDFQGSTDAVLVAQFNPPSCLHILSPVYDADLPLAPASGETYRSLSALAFPMLGRKAAIALPLSKPELIIASANPPASLPDIFGTEPIHNWCYYYEKADLARQAGDWPRVASLGDKAFAIPYHPDDQSEYFPFIEAYARTKRWDDAQKLTFSTADAMPILKPALCALWQRVDHNASLSVQEHDIVNKVEYRLNYCPTH
ncbi:MAG: hypothetical protein M1485_07340 [Chloroflexi bacterium]|nr:hypothetical protein [Chloroflexota bacterium]